MNEDEFFGLLLFGLVFFGFMIMPMSGSIAGYEIQMPVIGWIGASAVAIGGLFFMLKN
jgi:hypothetical protein